MGNVKKTKTANVPTKNGGSYKYGYTDLAAINDYLDGQKYTYDQYTEAFDTPDGLCDYIMTQRYRITEDGKLEEWGKPMRGLRIQYGNETPQQLGSRITYLRRYSLLMAFGLAAEDNDAVDVPPASPAQKRSEVSKVDFNEIRTMLKELDTEEELNEYWRSLGKLSESQAKFLQRDFARRKAEINGVE